jgi:prolyl-tRNA synthetase
VFFDTPERGLVFAVIRGDLEVNEAKLRAAAGVSELAPASADQIAAAGAVAGYASPVGLTIASFAVRETGVFVIADQSVATGGPLVAGANRVGYHLRNVVYGRDWQATAVADIAAVRENDPCARCGAALHFERGIEIGHIFKLGTRFTEALSAHYLDQRGIAHPVVMGSFGIGVDRLIQVIVEQHHDTAGIAWPASVAPADVHLVRLGKGDAVRAAADTLYDELCAAGVRALYDDRDETAGVKFNDADLIGLPLRLLISERLLAEGMVEIKRRGGEASKVAHGEVITSVLAFG